MTDLDFLQTELSSEQGKACGNPDAILHEDFHLSARKYIQMHTERVHPTSRLICFANGSAIVVAWKYAVKQLVDGFTTLAST